MIKSRKKIAISNEQEERSRLINEDFFLRIFAKVI
jgi:hypothetical protein